MKNIFKHIAAASALVLAVSSCMSHSLVPEDLDTPYISLELNALDPTVVTKADERNGVQEDNENLIKSFDYFIYTEGRTESNAVMAYHVDIPNGAEASYSYKIGIKAEEIGVVFPDGAQKCKIFVVANWPGSSHLCDMADTRLSTLKALTVETDFLAADAQGKPQPSLIMSGEADCRKGNKNEVVIATTTIDLKRLASRISVGVSVIKTYNEEVSSSETVTWTSHPESMGIIFCNAESKAVLSGNSAQFKGEFLFDYGSFSDGNFAPTDTRKVMTDTGAKDPKLSADESPLYGNVWTCDRFYSYPEVWDNGSDDEPYLIVRLYWSNGERSIPMYYKVILPGNEFVSNTWYHLNLRLSILGSLTPETPVVVTPEDFTYYVADWNDGCSEGNYVEAEIRYARYLVVDKSLFEMNNQNTIVIPFKSSHPCVLAGRTTKSVDKYNVTWNTDWATSNQPIVTMKKYNVAAGSTLCFKSNTSGLKDGTWAINEFKITVNTAKNQVEISHDLRNDTSKKPYDYSPYSVTFRIQHADNANVYEEITVVQYPALYIEADPNSNGVVANVRPDNTFVNNKHGEDYSSSNSKYLGGNPNESSNRGNTNGNMYIITTTVLLDDKYILADPRTTEIDNLNSGWDGWSQSAPSMQGTSRKLSYYYPTSESEEAEKTIAPKFRIASSYGACQPVTYMNAHRRCASYQEQGRPAGRWRVPTRAEVKYMAKLSGDGVIPILLSNDSKYWCTGGMVQPNDGSPKDFYETSGTTNVRCVYDEWYWANHDNAVLAGDKQKTFTWGDYAR